MNQDKEDKRKLDSTATDTEPGSSSTVREGVTQTEQETEEWLAVRRERLARERRRKLIIVTSVAVVALFLLFS